MWSCHCLPILVLFWLRPLAVFAADNDSNLLAVADQLELDATTAEQPEAEELEVQFDLNSCGLTKGCLLKPPNCVPHKDCAFALSFAADEERVYFELLGQVNGPQNAYVALGFSTDGLMGGDTVTDCSSLEGSPFAGRLSYNPGKSNRKVPLGVELEARILRTHSTHYADGTLYCRFSQLIFPPSNVQSQFVRSLDASFFILMSSGTTQKRELNIHSLDAESLRFPYSSPTPVSLLEYMLDPASAAHWPMFSTPKPANSSSASISLFDVFSSNSSHRSDITVSPSPISPKLPPKTGAKGDNVKGQSASAEPPAEGSSLIKAHGVLMLFSWLFIAPLAILSARFLRSEPIRLFRLQLWFQIHRAANAFVFLFVLVAFFCVFSAKGGVWTGPSHEYFAEQNLSAGSMHSLFGVIVVLLTVAQPLNALFRCSPDSPSRHIFNWLHWTIGYCAWMLAALCISIACLKFRSRFYDMDLTRDLLIALLVLTLVLFLALQWIAFCQKSEGTRQQHRRVVVMAGNNAASPSQPTGRENRFIVRAILSLFFVASTLLTLAMAVLIVIA